MTKTDKILCISDLHLAPERPDVYRAFQIFLEHHANTAQALYILGDLFNLWIGDDTPGDFPSAVKSDLRKLSSSGTDIAVMHGNRDFLLGKDFCDTCQAQLIEAPYILQCFGRSYLLMHGDSLCTRDTDYMAFRTLVRDPEWQQDFLAKSLRQRQAFADEARAKSKTMSSNKPQDIMDVTPEEVKKIMLDAGQDALIHGHTHRPGIHTLDLNGRSGTRIVLGDWNKLAWYLEIRPDGRELLNFPIEE